MAFELWPDSDEHQAHTNLRKLLHDLRHSLPDITQFIDIDARTVRWIPTGPATVDVSRFRDATASGDPELAARLYAGDLLPACYDDWVLEERAKLRSEAHGVFIRLAEAAEEADDFEAMLRHSQRLFDLEATDETAARLQMKAHLALGDRATALRTYHRLVERLEQDLGIAPSETIAGLYRDLRAGVGSEGDDPGHGLAPTQNSSFVGRAEEARRLVEAWDRTQEGQAQFLVISGEPGIGKSRLADELGRHVRADGHVVASARAYEAAGRLPWGPIVDLLRSDGVRHRIDELEPVWRTEIARLLPELLEASGPSRPTPSANMGQRHRLFDAVRRAVVAGHRPLLLIVDDLQWCDAETIELIGFVIRASETAPVLIVGTVRSEEVEPPHPLADLIEALDHDGALTRVALEPLDATETATLAARLRGVAAVEPELAARLWSESEGNPLFVTEILRAGIRSGDTRAVLTPTMRAVLSARLGQLSDGARRLAQVAAVIGRPFTVALAAGVTGNDEDDLVDHVDELWRRRIIREDGFAYDFTHDKLRAVALEMASPARRRQLHRAVARAIAAEPREIESAGPRLAAHYDQAGMIKPAIQAYQRAGAMAVEVSALEEAANMLRRALFLLADVPASPDRDALELDLRIALGSPLVALEGYGSKGAHQLYERAVSLCRRLHREVDAPILRGLGLAKLMACRFDEASKMGQALVDQTGDDPTARTEGKYLLGVSAFWSGDLAGARHHLVGAIETYDESHRDEHLASYAQDPKAVCLIRLALTELWAGDPGRGDQIARASLEYAVDLDHLTTLGYVATHASVVAAESGDLDRLGELLDAADRVWRRVPMRYLMDVTEVLRGWLEVCHGSHAGIERLIRAIARWRADGQTLHLTYGLLLLARARAETGEFLEGRVATRDALSWSRRFDQRYLEAELWRVDGELAYCSGEADAAAVALDNAARIANSQGAGWLELRALTSVAARFPGPEARDRLAEALETLPSGHDLPAVRAATDLLSEFR